MALCNSTELTKFSNFFPARTKSWVTLQPNRRQFSPKPVILKPLKLIKLDRRSRKMKWLYGNPWAFQVRDYNSR